MKYLSVLRYVAQTGIVYFLHVDSPIVDGAPLATFERCKENNERLGGPVVNIKERGDVVKSGFSTAHAEGLWKCANNALRFLVEADMSHRSTDFPWTHDNTSNASPPGNCSEKVVVDLTSPSTTPVVVAATSRSTRKTGQTKTLKVLSLNSCKFRHRHDES